MSSNIINQLPELQKHSGKHIAGVVKARLQSHSKQRALVKGVVVANANQAVIPIKGTSSLSIKSNQQCVRKVRTLSAGSEQLIKDLNKQLLGGESYPILTTAIGIAAGPISAGGALLFSLATTALSVARTTHNVLARPGDEIWHVEEIGKVGNKAVYVSSFFIVDPYRKQAHENGWLIHEEREDVILN